MNGLLTLPNPNALQCPLTIVANFFNVHDTIWVALENVTELYALSAVSCIP